jgi:hypothetical protein
VSSITCQPRPTTGAFVFLGRRGPALSVVEGALAREVGRLFNQTNHLVILRPTFLRAEEPALSLSKGRMDLSTPPLASAKYTDPSLGFPRFAVDSTASGCQVGSR